MASSPTPILTPEQYLEIDSRAERPSEYYGGVMYPIEATSMRHSDILANLLLATQERLKKRQNCKSTGPTVRVRLPNRRYAYPDVMVICGKVELEDKKYDTVVNPTVVFEVLSPSTGDFDRGGKSKMYRSIPSLCEYVVIAQDRMNIEWLSRQGEGSWLLSEVSDAGSLLTLESINIEIPLSEIYDGIEFDPDLED